MTSPRTILTYFGKKGAGPALAYSFSKELHSDDQLNRIFILKNDIENKFKSAEFASKVEISKTPVTLFLSIVNWLQKTRSQSFIFIPMHAPASVLCIVFLRLLNTKTFSIIHDFKPHAGDRSAVINIANFVICHTDNTTFFLSDSQLDLAKCAYPNRKSRFMRLKHPPFRHYEHTHPGNSTNYEFLFFGRIEIYKGINRLIEAFNLHRIKHPNSRLLIAGPSSSKGSPVELPPARNTTYKVQYIPDQHIPKIFNQSKCLILPYSDATQSGVLPLASSFCRHVISTPCPGIIEQSKDYKNITFSGGFSPKALSEAMNQFVESPPLNTQTGAIQSGIIQKLHQHRHKTYRTRIL